MIEWTLSFPWGHECSAHRKLYESYVLWRGNAVLIEAVKTGLKNGLPIPLPPIAFGGFLTVQGAFGLWAASGQRGVDFSLYYLAAQALRRGENVYDLVGSDWASLASQYQVKEFAPPYAYPPLTAGVISLFAWLPGRDAAIVWFVLSFAALVLSGFALSQLLGERWIDPVVFGALALYVPNLTTLYAGQVNTLVLLGTALYLALVKNRRLYAAGFALASAVMFKPLVAPLIIHLFWRRDLRKIVAVCIGLFAVLVVTLLLAGPHTLASYLETGWRIPHIALDGSSSGYPPNQSLFGFFDRALTAHDYGPSLADDPGLARAFSLGLGGLLLLGVAVTTWPRGGSDWNTFALETGLVLVTINLITPIGWYHHAVISIIPLLVVWHLTPSRSARAWLAVAFFLISAQGIAWHQLVGYTFLLSLGTYGLLIIYSVTIVHLLQMKPPSPSSATRR